jgi:hypothetical protein
VDEETLLATSDESSEASGSETSKYELGQTILVSDTVLAAATSHFRYLCGGEFEATPDRSTHHTSLFMQQPRRLMECLVSSR